MRQNTVIKHNCIEFIALFKTSDITEERASALRCKIKGFGKYKRLVILVYHSEIHLGDLDRIGYRPEYRIAVAARNIATESDIQSEIQIFTYRSDTGGKIHI